MEKLTKAQIEEIFTNKQKLLNSWSAQKAEEYNITRGDCFTLNGNYYKVVDYYAKEEQVYLFPGDDPENQDVHYELILILVTKSININNLTCEKEHLNIRYSYKREPMSIEDWNKAERILNKNLSKINKIKEQLTEVLTDK